MLQTLRNAWMVTELRKKILYTLLMLVVYRLLCFIPVPGVDTTFAQQAVNTYGLLGFINSMTGSDLANYTIMAMGITPYINASIIMQLLTVAIPALEDLNKQGTEGRKKIAQYSRYLTVALGFLQALALTIGLRANASGGLLSLFVIGFCLAAGTAIAMWIGERITENGVGNGISLLIFSGIIANFAHAISGTVYNMFVVPEMMFEAKSIITMVVVVLMSLLLIVGVIFVDRGERKIPVQYAKRMVGRKMYGGQSTHIPLKVNSSGVLPLIFASALMQFPGTILAFFPNSAANQWWTANVSYTGVAYQVIFALLILGFTFFYSAITFNPVEMSKQMQQNGGMIPGIRQGKPTAEFIAKISKRITLFGAIFLAILATIPTVMYGLFQINLPFQASSLLIAVSVALETSRQIESQLLMRHYKGFIK